MPRAELSRLRRVGGLALVLGWMLALGAAGSAAQAPRPNIVWIVVDDMSANFSCYGEKTIRTPHVDRLAAEGTLFRRAFITAPVCSPCRSALITGMYQTTIGAHHHRSGRGVEKIRLPAGVEPVPALFQRAGYHTSIGSWPNRGRALGKTDYNFEWDASLYDGNDWAGRKDGQPFFHQVQLHGGKHREGAGWAEKARAALGSLTPVEAVKLPPYYPDDPLIREDWARYLDAVRFTDQQVGEVMERLGKEGLLENTLVFFITDHGISHARGKQFLYDEGMHIPMVVRGPGVGRGRVREDLVQHIDLAAASLRAAGISLPAKLQGKPILDRDYRPREAVYAARDRCDETVERLRAVRTQEFKYIRNGYPHRPHLQPNAYKDNKPILIRLRELHAQRKLDSIQEGLFAPERPAEELYRLEGDPHELRNLAAEPAHRRTLERMRRLLDTWIAETGDLGQKPESDAMYDSDMAVYLGAGNRPNARRDELVRNIALMKQWAKEGR